MTDLLSVIGYIGTGIVIGAYAPQISHLWTEHCSAGISERAYALWVLASAVFLGHSIMIGDTVFMVTQLVNLVALATSWSSRGGSITRSAPCMRASFTYESSSRRGRPQMSNQKHSYGG
jgi:uncharacterized protein with PQ loop repeat